MASLYADIAEFVESLSQNGFNWFDLAARLWVYTTQAAPSEGLLISQFFGHADDESVRNPNLDTLLRLERDVADFVERAMSLLLSFEDACAGISSKLGTLALVSFGDPKYSLASVYWTVLKGIDLAVAQSAFFDRITKRGPLNSLDLEFVGVYLAPLSTPMHRYMPSSTLECVTSQASYNRQLTAIRFRHSLAGESLPKLRKAECRNALRPSAIARLSEAIESVGDEPSEGDGSSSQAAEGGFSGIKVGMVPFTGLNLAAGEYPQPIRFVKLRGTAFVAEYADSYMGCFAEIVESSMAAAVDEDCDVLVFPELTISPDALSLIRSKLREPALRNRLKLVVAGSTWESDGDGSAGNNVCHLFDGAGNEIGTYYKRVPFEQGDVLDGFVEALSNPGGRTTIVDVEEVGRVVVGICKDLASNEQHTVRLAADFGANLVVVPAMSGSMKRAFANPLDCLSNQYLAIGIICNLCGLRPSDPDKSADICRVTAPTPSEGQNVKLPKAVSQSAYREPGCQQKCREMCQGGAQKPCFVTADISPDSAGNGFCVSMKSKTPVYECEQ